MIRQSKFGLAFSAMLLSHFAMATHIRSGEINMTRLSCNSLRYRITLTVYTNTASPTHPGGWAGGGLLSWDEGSMNIPQITNVTIVNAALNIGKVVFTKDVTFSREGDFVISYDEAHRNSTILNIPNQNDNLDFYVEDHIRVSRTFCDSSPSFLVQPIDQGCKGQAFVHNPGASDRDGDSLSFSLAVPKSQGGVDIAGYADPNDSKFYTSIGLDYQTSNSQHKGPPSFSINGTTGLLTWDAPGMIGSYNIAIKVQQWKKNPADSTWMEFGYVVRDMQIEIVDCGNRPPALTAVSDICVLEGDLVNVNVKGSDPDFDKVVIEVFSDITSFIESPAQVKYSGNLQSPDTAHIKISWRPDCMRVRDQPYQVVIKITDQPSSGAQLTSFKSFNIKVMARPPAISDIQANPAVKKVTLTWNTYACASAEAIQIWRRVSKRNYKQAKCEVGMPKSLQYQLIAEASPNTTAYEDHDLAIGAQYCYRIVARFKDVGSKISLDTCIIPQPAKAPVITNVTVNKTNPDKGEIQISWRPPYDIDKIQYPPPYQYQVQRANSFSGGDWSTVTQGLINDTTIIDNSVPTVDTAYHYRVLLYVPGITSSSVDTSSVASSIRLKGKSSSNNIQLSWDAKVPWSIFLEKYPYHHIYRGEDGADGPFVLIDSVDVNQDGLVYVDVGKYNNQPLNDHKIYSYKVETLGGYGNPKIKEPLINFSQAITIHLRDTIPPCPPIMKVIKPDCDNLPCALSYSNMIKWYNDPNSKCQNDVVSFEIYFSNSTDGTFTKWSDPTDSLVVQTSLQDLSVCYKVIAVDWVGNRSAFSTEVCGENCPTFNMPNVFTPDVTLGFNDLFTTFKPNGDLLKKECTRFIDFLSLTVINRWGKEIYSSSSSDVEKVFWDGKDSNGIESPTGVYYYVAEARLNYSTSKSEMKKIKGWVSLIR